MGKRQEYHSLSEIGVLETYPAWESGFLIGNIASRVAPGPWQRALGIERERRIYKQSTEVYKRNSRKPSRYGNMEGQGSTQRFMMTSYRRTPLRHSRKKSGVVVTAP